MRARWQVRRAKGIAVRLKKPMTGFPARAAFLRRYGYAGDLPDVSKPFLSATSCVCHRHDLQIRLERHLKPRNLLDRRRNNANALRQVLPI
jgi:hypothetical protein